MLNKLREYRETIAIVAFFLGGFIWISKTFPDKTYLDGQIKTTASQLDGQIKATAAQMAQLNCLLTNNIEATDAQLQIKIHADNIDHGRARLVVLRRKLSQDLSDEERNEIDDLSRNIENERDYLQKERTRADDILKSLKASRCRNV